jgi:hypothetical protein
MHRSYEWRYFLFFTFLSLAVIVVSGIASPIVISKGIAVMGLTERITGYTFYLWLFVLAFLLVREQSVQMPLNFQGQ